MERRPYMILSKPMSGGQGCFYCKVKAAIHCAAARAGTRSPHTGVKPISGIKGKASTPLTTRIRRVSAHAKRQFQTELPFFLSSETEIIS